MHAHSGLSSAGRGAGSCSCASRKRAEARSGAWKQVNSANRRGRQMGKVYEALNRARKEAYALDLSDEVVEAVQEYVPEYEPEYEPQGEPLDEAEDVTQVEPSAGRFHFMRYSLGVTSLVTRGRPANVLTQRTASRPGRELTVDRDQIGRAHV